MKCRNDETASRRAQPSLLVVVVALAIHSGLLASAACRHGPAYDEVGHLAAGISHWKYGRFDLYPQNPPLVRMVAAIPVLLAGVKTDWTRYSDTPEKWAAFAVGEDLVRVNGERSFWLFMLARFACIPFSLLGGYLCYRWANDLYGPTSGLLAITLWCFSPNIIANAIMITPDLEATAVGMAGSYLCWHWLKAPSWSNALRTGLVLGIAQLTKATWIILFVLWPLLWFIFHCIGRGRNRSTWRSEAGQLSAILLIGVYVVNVGYGFEGSFQRLDKYEFVSQMFAGRDAGDSPSQVGENQFEGTWLGSLPVPLPKNYLTGIDVQRSDFECGRWAYLWGKWKEGGWWHYYLCALAVKVPLGTWVLFLMAVGVTVGDAVKSSRRTGALGDVAKASHFSSHALREGEDTHLSPNALLSVERASVSWRSELVLLAPALVILVFVSSQTGINRHLRYVLPMFPFVFVWISKVGRFFDGTRWRLASVAATALVWSVGSSLWVYPHSLSYFNELGDGLKNGHAHLLSSNIDWGQDLLYLKRWYDQHPEARPFHLAYNGLVDPEIAGIEYTQPPVGLVDQSGSARARNDLESGPQPGWHAVSVTHLRDRSRRYAYFLNFEPVAMAGYSIYIYHVTLDEANRVRRELGMEELRTESGEREEGGL